MNKVQQYKELKIRIERLTLFKNNFSWLYVKVNCVCSILYGFTCSNHFIPNIISAFCISSFTYVRFRVRKLDLELEYTC